MGCNTSSEAKAAGEDQKDKSQGNHAESKGSEEDQKQEKADNTDPSEVQAATKIQAVFRGHKTRKTMKAASKPSNASKQAEQKPEPEPSKAELEAEFREDDKELCHAATKIQASFRGHQARKQTQAEKDKELQDQQDKEDIEKIDLADPDLNKAATKIQASFRGHKVRKDGDAN